MPPELTPFQALKQDWEELRRLPYHFRRLSLTAAGEHDEEYIGNAIVVLKLAGASPELRIRLNEEGNDEIRVTSECVIPLVFHRVIINWEAIVGGEADLLFCTVIP